MNIIFKLSSLMARSCYISLMSRVNIAKFKVGNPRDPLRYWVHAITSTICNERSINSLSPKDAYNVSINYAIIGSDNGLLFVQCKTITWIRDRLIINWNLVKYQPKYEDCYQRKCIGKCLLQNGCHFVQAALCYHLSMPPADGQEIAPNSLLTPGIIPNNTAYTTNQTYCQIMNAPPICPLPATPGQYRVGWGQKR